MSFNTTIPSEFGPNTTVTDQFWADFMDSDHLSSSPLHNTILPDQPPTPLFLRESSLQRESTADAPLPDFFVNSSSPSPLKLELDTKSTCLGDSTPSIPGFTKQEADNNDFLAPPPQQNVQYPFISSDFDPMMDISDRCYQSEISIKIPPLVVNSNSHSSMIKGKLDFTLEFSSPYISSPKTTSQQPPPQLNLDEQQNFVINPPATSLIKPEPHPPSEPLAPEVPVIIKPEPVIKPEPRVIKTEAKQSVRRPTNKLLKCRYCLKSFSRHLHKKQHERSHTGDRPYGCTENGCLKRFKQKSHLTRHVRDVHKGIKLHKCRVCKREFGQRSNMKIHAKTCSRRVAVAAECT